MTYTPEQQKENRKKWVEALRSGKFEQCVGALHNGVGHCCLGVLCEVAGYTAKKGQDSYYRYEGIIGEAALPIRAFVGLSSPIGEYGGICLAELNDNGKSFAEIADIIESEPPGLFNDS